jgi:hypothetical protein
MNVGKHWVIFREIDGGEIYFVGMRFVTAAQTPELENAEQFATAREAYAFAGQYPVLADWKVGLR